VNREEIVAAIMRRPGPVRLVAIDGPGAAGKTTFAAALASAAGDAPVLHTDDFASADNPIDWWPRMLELAIAPLAKGRTVRFQRYDWPTETWAEWVAVEPAPIVIIEGVSAARREWREHLAFIVWMETPREIRLQRALARGGDDADDEWDDWMAAEDAHYARDPTREHADVVIS
jgi:uridine kinase